MELVFILQSLGVRSKLGILTELFAAKNLTKFLKLRISSDSDHNVFSLLNCFVNCVWLDERVHVTLPRVVELAVEPGRRHIV